MLAFNFNFRRLKERCRGTCASESKLMRLTTQTKIVFSGLIITISLFSLLAVGQNQPTDKTNNSNVSQTTSREFEDARRANEEAQAEYYREQTQMLRKGNPSKT